MSGNIVAWGVTPNAEGVLTSLPIRGVLSTATGPTLALPTGTVVGDYLVVAISTSDISGNPGGSTITDARFPLLAGSHLVYSGEVTSLGDITINAPSSRLMVTVISFGPGVGFDDVASTSLTIATTMETTIPVDPVSSNAGVMFIQLERPNSVANHFGTAPDPAWTLQEYTSSFVNQNVVYTFFDSGASVTPSGVYTFTSGFPAGVRLFCTVVGLGAA